MNSDALYQLAANCGILPRYFDIWGEPHDTSPETTRALLGAMGIGTETDEAVIAALAARRLSGVCRALPPVLVVHAEQPIAIPISVPQHCKTQQLAWTLTLESGQQVSGTIDCAALPTREELQCAGETRLRVTLNLAPVSEFGYHRFELYDEAARPLAPAMPLVVAPTCCHQPPAIRNDGRVWGIAVQLYGLRSRRNWGIGDFGDLRALIEVAGALGASVVGVSPLHALFPARPDQISPYSPSHRSFVNALYLDVEAIADCRESTAIRQHIADAAFQTELAGLRAAELVDYRGVAQAKWPVLEQCYAHFRQRHLAASTARGEQFRAYQSARGAELARHALHDALHEHFLRDGCYGWPVWPAPYRDVESAAVANFADEHRERVEFFAYVQWQCDLQLAQLSALARQMPSAVGLYPDLALGVDRAGAETWSQPAAFALTASAGAPADEYNVNGQDWGLPPYIPERLTAAAYAPFIRLLRANMRHAAALRLDHVMALQRLFWVPAQQKASAGAYVEYPLADLLAILVLESERNRCLIIGEDLGTVSPALREALQAAAVLSYRPVYFEKNAEENFRAPSEYPAQALVSLSTHDLPTLRGYWADQDIHWRQQLGLYPSPAMREAQLAARARDRAALVAALEREGLAVRGNVSDPSPAWSPALTNAVHEFLARSPAKLLLVQAEDVLGELEQANLPGTVDEHPNWRRKLAVEIEMWREAPAWTELAARINAVRGNSGSKRG